MGQCCSSNEINSEKTINKLRDREIDEQLKKEKQSKINEVKLLLLGTGESGKSTLLKQMRIIHEGGIHHDERLGYRETILINIIDSMKAIVQAMQRFDIRLATQAEDSLAALELIDNLPEYMECGCYLEPNIESAITLLWKDAGVLEAYNRKNEYQLHDSAAYFLNDMNRICARGYIPNDQDLLRARVKTTGITEAQLTVGKLNYRMIDVGGQRSERKKWIHCFEDVTAIIFMVAISEYDQVLMEDEGINRMTESFDLFQTICSMTWFSNTSIILFMNKTDLFRKKLISSPFKTYFPSYQGKNDYDSAFNYLKTQFQGLTAKTSEKEVYIHPTCATDTDQIRKVMKTVNDLILRSTLKDVGLL